MDDHLTPVEFTGIYNNLHPLSDSWADLWMMLYITGMPVGRILNLQYTDIYDGKLMFKSYRGFKENSLIINVKLKKLIEVRAKRYPDDIYIFQSHSNFKKLNKCPLTLIAFNRALKVASKAVTSKVVSSKSAYIKQRLCYI